MIRHLITMLFCATAALTATAQPVVVELFASQNCRACPTAHETLKKISEADSDILVLTWSVDYWDYLGEEDPMAMKESTDRQAGYVERFRLRGPYTPQTVYNGLSQCPGNRPRAVENNVRDARSQTLSSASITHTGTSLLIEGDENSAGRISVIEYLPDDAHSTDMRHPVTGIRTITQFKGGTLEIAVPACDKSCAVILETDAHGIPAALAL